MTVPALIGIASVPPPPTFAQGENVENPNIPRTADGKPNLAAPTPRAPDGKPDLSEKDIHHLGVGCGSGKNGSPPGFGCPSIHRGKGAREVGYCL